MPTTRPDVSEGERDHAGLEGGWIVTVFNNDYNTYDEVIHILQAATGCDVEEAYIETWEIDNLGQSVVHHSSKAECDNVAAVISTIGIQVSVSEQ